MPTDRLPDFVIIGAMKAGTTTLFRWLDEVDGVALPAHKEPQYLDRPAGGKTDLDGYQRFFETVPVGTTTGEASATYADPNTIDVTAARIAQWLPDTRLIYLVREPVERLRSHYRHEVLRGRETQPLGDAATLDSDYVARSSYSDVLAGLQRHGLIDRLVVESFEDLTGPDDAAWHRICAHLGLPATPRPATAFNQSTDKGQYRPAMRVMHDLGLVRLLERVPGPLRSRLRRLAIDDSDEARRAMVDSSLAPLAPGVIAHLDEQARQLAHQLGRDPLW